MSAALRSGDAEDPARMAERLHKLADEKAYLQLIIRLIEQIDPLPGIEDMVTNLLRSMVETIGGTNIKLYYWIEQELHYADFAGERAIVTAIDDPLAAASAERREFLELAKDAEAGLLRGDVSPGTWTWAFPLVVGDELIGVIMLENLHFPVAPLRNYLPIFFSHAALILGNEVRAYTRRRAEAELARYRDHLEQLVEERTSELRERENSLQQNLQELTLAHAQLKQLSSQLLQSEKLASLGRLAAGVAHEINNPIGFVKSNLGTLKADSEGLLRLIDAYAAIEAGATPEQRRLVEATKREIDIDYLRQDIDSLIAESVEGIGRVSRIVLALREFSDTGTTEWQAADINDCLDRALEVAGRQVTVKAEVRREYGDLPAVECLPAQIGQVFVNLLVNAAQAIPQRGWIALRTARDGDFVTIAVADNGCGIAAADRERIFDPFFTTRGVGQGVGLGLSVAYGIVANHGGSIEVDSRPGAGSTFLIRLPIRRAH